MSDRCWQHMAVMDSDSLEKLMAQYGQDVWNFAFFLTKSRYVADDIAQDVFLKAYQHISSFRGESSIKTWLLTITRNVSTNYRRSAFLRRVLLMGIVERDRAGGSAEQDFLEREAVNEVWRQVFHLPAHYRSVLVLHAKHQLTIPEIAQVLQIPEGTVRSRLFTARKRLTNMLKEEWSHESI